MRYALVVAIAFIVVVYFVGKKQCEKENIILEKDSQIRVHEIIINETKQVNERRFKALTAAADANILWLKENICQDCR